MNIKGQGTITERIGKTKTTYQAKVKADGVYYTDTFPTKKEANTFLQDISVKLRKGESVDHTQIKKTLLADIFEDYLKNNESIPKLKQDRLKKLVQEIGKVPLEKFSSLGMEQYLKTKLSQSIPPQLTSKKPAKIDAKTYSPASIRKYYYDIRTALKWHSKRYDYVFNSKPFDDNPAPAAWSNPRDRRLIQSDIDKLIVACDKMYVNREVLKSLIQFQQYSAMRIGETLKMKWSDIRLNENEPSSSFIFIPKANQKTRNKASAKDRYVTLRRELYFLLKDTILQSEKSNELVFPYWNNISQLDSRFRNICRNAGIENFRIHDLRHEAISWFFENTTLTDIEISNISGHIEMDTLKRYANLRPNMVGAKLWAGAK